jgi:PAS domain S-box-containing protein
MNYLLILPITLSAISLAWSILIVFRKRTVAPVMLALLCLSLIVLAITAASAGEVVHAAILWISLLTFIAVSINARGMNSISRRQNAHHCRAVVEQSRDVVVLIEIPSGIIIQANSAFTRLLGYDDRDIPGLSIYDLVDLPKNQVDEPYGRLISGEQSYLERRPYRARDGRFVELDAHVSRITVEGRNLISVVAHTFDERDAMNKQVRTLTDRFQDIADNVFDLVWELDANARVVFVSGRARKILGYEPEQLIGRRVQHLVPDDERKNVSRDFRSVRSGAMMLHDTVVPMVRADGSDAILRSNGMPMRDDEGSIVGYRGVSKDISDQIRAKKQQRARDLRYRALVENAKDGIIVTSSTGVIELANSAASLILSSPDDGLTGSLLSEVVQERIRPSWEEAIERVTTHGTTENIECPVAIGAELRHFAVDFLPVLGETGETGDDIPVMIFARDITARKEAQEEELRAERTRARVELDQTVARHRAVRRDQTEFICRLDPDRTIVEANETLCTYLGVRRETLIGGRLAPFIHLEDRPDTGTVMETLSLDRPHLKTRFRMVLPDGQTRWTEWEVRSEFDEDGRTVAIRGQGRDLTEEIEVLQGLRDSEERFRTFVDYAHDWELWTDRDGAYLYLSPSCERLTGYPVEEFLENPDLLKEITHPDDRETVIDHLGSHGQNVPDGVDFRIFAQDGTLKWVHQVCRPVYSDDGKFLGTRTTNSDVTQRVAAEGALRESESRFRSVFDNSTMGMYRITPYGRITMANPALVRMLGFDSPEELSSRDLVTGGFRHDMPREQFVREMEAGGRVTGLESRWFRKDGTIVTVRESAYAVLDSEGNPLYYEGSVEDVTDWRRLQELLRIEHELAVVHTSVQGLQETLNQIANVLAGIEGMGAIVIYGLSPGIPEAWIVAHSGSRTSPDFVSQISVIPADSAIRDLVANGTAYYGHASDPETAVYDLETFGARAVAFLTAMDAGKPVAAIGLISWEYDDIPDYMRQILGGMVQRVGELIARLQTADTQRKNHHMLQELFDSMRDLVFATDATGKILYANRAALECLGYTEDVVTNLTLSDLHPPEASEEVAGLPTIVLREGSQTCRHRLMARDGTCISSGTVFSAADWDGERAVFGIARNLSEEHEGNLLQLRQLMDLSPHSAYLKDRNARFLLVNRAMTRAFGKAQADMIGQSDTIFASDEARIEQHREEDRRVMDEGETLVCPEETVIVAGIPRVFQTTKMPFIVAGRSEPAVMGIIAELTEGSPVVEALQESEHQYRLLAESMQEGLAIIGTEGEFTHVNDGLCEILGYERADLLGKPVADILGKENRDAFDLERLASSQGNPVMREIVWNSGNDERVTVFMTPQLMHDSDGRVIGAFAIVVDMTQGKVADEMLFSLMQRNTKVLDTAMDGFVVTDQKGRIIEANSATTDLTGVSQHHLSRKKLVDLICPTDRERVSHKLESLGSSETDRFTASLARSDGTTLDVLISSRCTVLGEEPFLFSFIQDITETAGAQEGSRGEREKLAQRVEERTSELKIANAELARSARLKDEFLASMSHELRTPLNAILGISEALQEEVYGDLSEKQLRFLHTIEDSGKHLLALINDILDLSKIEAGKVRLNLGAVSVKSVCESGMRMIRQLAHEKRITTEFDLTNVREVITADERRLKQMLVNLLTNAVKFTPSGGKVGLHIEDDEVIGLSSFTVWDTGTGIRHEDFGKLFRPFVQLDSSLSRQYAGTGLGLSLVFRMAEMHGGGVSVESVYGEGSRFTVYLPWSGPEGKPEYIDTIDPNQIDGNPLAMIADDNETTLQMYSALLKSHGYRVTTARNGMEAVEVASEELPVLVLMDVEMPIMGGLDAIGHIRSSEALEHTGIIAMSSLHVPGVEEQCIQAGADLCVRRPVLPALLIVEADALTVERMARRTE